MLYQAMHGFQLVIFLLAVGSILNNGSGNTCACLTKKKKEFTLDEFNTYEDIINQLYVWADSCPPGFDCDVVSLGQSIEEREILQLRIERGSRRGIWIDSLIHAREWVAGSTILHYIARLIDEYDTDDTSRDLMDEYNFYFTPVVNPDGYVYTWTDDRMWRKNRRVNEGSDCLGIDLNKNFDAYWDTNWGASDDTCDITYRGPHSVSEPETAAIQDSIDSLDIDILLSFHAGAYMWIHPWAWTDDINSCVRSDDHDDQYAVAKAAAEATMVVYNETFLYGNTCETLDIFSGVAADYAYQSGIKYSYAPELRGPGQDPGPEAIEPAYRESWAGWVALINKVAEIEDW